MLKARASLKGISVGEAINDAIRLWLESESKSVNVNDKRFWDAAMRASMPCSVTADS